MLETARGGLLQARHGLPRANVGAVLNVQADHLGLRGIDTLEDLAEVKRIVVEVARDTAVLNADDASVPEDGRLHEGRAPLLRHDEPQHPLVREHIRAGGRAVVLEEGINGHMITIYDGGAHIPLLWTHLIPATLEGRGAAQRPERHVRRRHRLQHGVKLEDIRHGLRPSTPPSSRPRDG